MAILCSAKAAKRSGLTQALGLDRFLMRLLRKYRTHRSFASQEQAGLRLRSGCGAGAEALFPRLDLRLPHTAPGRSLESPGCSLQTDLTMHSTRCRFAARVNSGVRPHTELHVEFDQEPSDPRLRLPHQRDYISHRWVSNSFDGFLGTRTIVYCTWCCLLSHF